MEIIQIIIIIILTLSILYCLMSFNMIYSLFWLILIFINFTILVYTLDINTISIYIHLNEFHFFTIYVENFNNILLIIYTIGILILFIFSIKYNNLLKINTITECFMCYSYSAWMMFFIEKIL